MVKYIGLDVHATSCTAAIITAGGKRLGSHVIETSATAIIDFLNASEGSFISVSRKAAKACGYWKRSSDTYAGSW